jgi:hypothetical protein
MFFSRPLFFNGKNVGDGMVVKKIKFYNTTLDILKTILDKKEYTLIKGSKIASILDLFEIFSLKDNEVYSLLSQYIIVSLTVLKTINVDNIDFNIVIINYFIKEENVKFFEKKKIIENITIIPSKEYNLYMLHPIIGVGSKQIIVGEISKATIKALPLDLIIDIEDDNDIIKKSVFNVIDLNNEELKGIMDKDCTDTSISIILDKFIPLIMSVYNNIDKNLDKNNEIALSFTGFNQYILTDKNS